ncbi:hypothetical protein FYJ75_04605 [Roseburia sp. MUC/MUC-530-WT-4D]|uniref:Uncharacterized protein n=1 Tax=Roseburia porci TaxID=2605790 RepID=A0A6L5YQZ8_9FIRM|nr:hypothetical protein [Roseburia porci]MST74316.1 hypothetical protein [Roseburia porci]
MKEVMEQYGSILLAALTGVLMITFLMGMRQGENRGIHGIAGAVLEAEGRDLLMEEQTNAFAEYRKTAVPQFVSSMEREIKKETKIRLDEICKALDWNGNEIPVWIVALHKQNGEPCTWSEQDMKSYVQFPGSGIYYIQVRAMDAMGREQCAVITVPVQE